MDTEKDALVASLNQVRRHIIGALEGLSEADLHRPALPSGWTPLGMVRHLTLDVEQFWFQCAVAGEPFAMTPAEESWRVAADEPGSAVISQYSDAIAKADAIIAVTPLDAMPKWWPGFFNDFPARPLRSTILHVITETACHAGHLDAARELTDGTQWLVLD